jgi:hypothetical protein
VALYGGGFGRRFFVLNRVLNPARHSDGMADIRRSIKTTKGAQSL